jgi:hypothetical protein
MYKQNKSANLCLFYFYFIILKYRSIKSVGPKHPRKPKYKPKVKKKCNIF